MLGAVILLPAQDVQKLVGRCDTIRLLGGIKSVGDSSETKLLQSQVFVENLQASGSGNPEVSSKKLPRRKRKFF
jgi:5'-3' exonuclease